MKPMRSNKVHSLIACLILSVGYLTTVQAVTDAELDALEKQIEQQEVEENLKAEAEAKLLLYGVPIVLLGYWLGIWKNNRGDTTIEENDKPSNG